jgi:hypothetical protein
MGKIPSAMVIYLEEPGYKNFSSFILHVDNIRLGRNLPEINFCQIPQAPYS